MSRTEPDRRRRGVTVLKGVWPQTPAHQLPDPAVEAKARPGETGAQVWVCCPLASLGLALPPGVSRQGKGRRGLSRGGGGGGGGGGGLLGSSLTQPRVCAVHCGWGQPAWDRPGLGGPSGTFWERGGVTLRPEGRHLPGSTAPWGGARGRPHAERDQRGRSAGRGGW